MAIISLTLILLFVVFLLIGFDIGAKVVIGLYAVFILPILCFILFRALAEVGQETYDQLKYDLEWMRQLFRRK